MPINTDNVNINDNVNSFNNQPNNFNDALNNVDYSPNDFGENRLCPPIWNPFRGSIDDINWYAVDRRCEEGWFFYCFFFRI